MGELKGDATPGVPWCDLGSSNSVILADPVKFDLLREAVLLRILDIVALGSRVFGMSAAELVKYNVCSPIRVFVKDEPHRSTKRSSGKLRLISGVAVDDQVIDRMVFGLQNNLEIDNWFRLPSKPGLGLDDSGLRILSSGFEEMLRRGPLQSTDVSGWDWSVQEWEMKIDLRTRQLLAGVHSGDLLYHLMSVRSYAAARKVFVLPDGSMFAQTRPGVQPSGWYCTSSTNSRMRVAARLAVVGADSEDGMRVVAMGDDAVEGALADEHLDSYRELGHVVKGASVFTALDGVEFCSHKFTPDGLAHPVNKDKTLFRFFSHPPTSDQYLDWYAQLRNDLRNVPEVADFLEVARAHAERAKEYGKEGLNAQSRPASPGC